MLSTAPLVFLIIRMLTNRPVPVRAKSDALPTYLRVPALVMVNVPSLKQSKKAVNTVDLPLGILLTILLKSRVKLPTVWQYSTDSVGVAELLP